MMLEFNKHMRTLLKQLPRLVIVVVILALTLAAAALIFSRAPARESHPYSLKEGIGGDPSVRIWGRIDNPDQGPFPGYLSLAITGVSLYPTLATGGKEACVESVTVDLVTKALPSCFGTTSGIETVIYHRCEFTPTQTQPCVAFDPEPDWRSYQFTELDWKTEVDTDLRNRAYYFYPFDRLAIRGEIITTVCVKDSSGRVISRTHVTSSQTLGFRLQGWEITPTTMRMQLLSDSPKTTESMAHLALLIERPLLIRILVPAVLLVLLFVIVVLPFVETLHSKLEVTVAVVIGLVGARQALLPAGSPSFIAVDALLLVELLAVALAVACHPFSKPLEPKPATSTVLAVGSARNGEVRTEEMTEMQASVSPSPSIRQMHLGPWVLVLVGSGVAAFLYHLWKSQGKREKMTVVRQVCKPPKLRAAVWMIEN